MDVTALQNVDLSARGLRYVADATTFPGVDGPADFLVGPRDAGANMSVDVAAGLAVVDGGARGSYVVSSGGAVNVVIGAAPGAGESRIDLVVLLVSDSEYAGVDDEAEVVVVAGTADPSPVAPSVPTGGLLLAQVLVEDDTTSIGSGAITDKRGPSRPVTDWGGTPATGTNGQIVFTAAGGLLLRDGGSWVAYLAPDQFQAAQQTQSLKAGPYSAWSQWGATLTVPGGTPTGAVLVHVQIAGFVDDYITGDHVFEISDDGGSTWHRSPVFPGAAYRAYEVLFETPSGEIQARILMKDAVAGSDETGDAGCVFTATVTPVQV